MKKKNLIIIVAVVMLIIGGVLFSSKSNNYSYEWVEVKDSMIGQYRLYVNNGLGKHIDGKVTITYLNGKSEEVKISKDGELYVKSIITKVEKPRK